MKRRLRFRASARRDLAEIAGWSDRTWGRAKTRTYLNALEMRCQQLADNPMIGQEVEEPALDLRKIASGRHVIFYLSDKDTVEIVRVLHHSMDFHAHLR